jgi:enoyl-CoA hydratase/carnithine racemase
MALLREVRGPVTWLMFDRPSDGNRWNVDVSEELRPLVAQIAQDDGCHVVVVSGNGTDFCLGSFNPVIRASMSKQAVVDFVIDANGILDAFERLPQITIAALNGPARGSGVEFALACDLRYAAQSASIVFPEADMGGFPGAGGPVRLPRVVGDARAIELICTGKSAGAAELKAWGFVQDVFADDVFVQHVSDIAQGIARKGPLALRGTKKIVQARGLPGFFEARHLSDKDRRALEWSADVDEAQAAHREGRLPQFMGR